MLRQIISLPLSSPKCLPMGVHPNQPVVLGVADADVAGDALCKSYARPVPKHGRHVDDNVLPVLVERRELGNS